jgi:hypothetical protein
MEEFMSKRVQDEAPARTDEVQAWLEENIAEQVERHEAIVREMEELEPQREKWYAEFLEIIQTTGFNVNGDIKRVIKPEEIPEKPDRPNKVVF